jgi:hypothetical protein
LITEGEYFGQGYNAFLAGRHTASLGMAWERRLMDITPADAVRGLNGILQVLITPHRASEEGASRRLYEWINTGFG